MIRFQAAQEQEAEDTGGETEKEGSVAMQKSGGFDVFDGDVGILHESPLFAWLVSQKWPIYRRLSLRERVVDYPIAGRLWKVALPITFTPFASTQPCSARCVFCSETLIHKDSSQLSASLRPQSDYFEGLQRALFALRDLPLCFSLSGLEATDQAAWLESLLDLLQQHQENGGRVDEKVLYSNAAGLARETTGERLLPRLRAFALTRAEISRHHHTQEKNDAIMRFRRGQPIREQAVFERTLREMLDAEIPVRLVCVLQADGVSSAQDIRDYLTWAASLGVTDVVFREFSRLHDLYEENQTRRNIEKSRVVLEDLLSEIFLYSLPKSNDWIQITAGYYFWNIEMKTTEGVRVTFETSDYREMKKRHQSDVLYKLVYHANGNLCGDWDPQRAILWTPLLAT